MITGKLKFLAKKSEIISEIEKKKEKLLQIGEQRLFQCYCCSRDKPVLSLCLFCMLCTSFVSKYEFYTYTVLTFGDAQGDDDENSLPHLDHGFHSKLPPGILPHGLPTVQEVAPAITPQEKKNKEDEKKQSKSDHNENG